MVNNDSWYLHQNQFYIQHPFLNTLLLKITINGNAGSW